MERERFDREWQEVRNILAREQAEQEQSTAGSEDDYLVTKDIVNHFDVAPATVYRWFKLGWVKADKTLPQNPRSKRNVGRYHIPVDEFRRLDEEAMELWKSGQLRRFVPRLLNRKGQP